jgi:hypothetical protein
MSFRTIRIYRDLPVIAGFVQLPPCREQEKTKKTAEQALTALASADIIALSLGSGRDRGAHHGQQEMIRLPSITPNTWYSSDPVATISNA